MSTLESFPALGLPGVAHAFTLRVPDVDVATLDKSAALDRLHPHHLRAVGELGFQTDSLRTAEQVHGAKLAVVDSGSPTEPISGTDGLITAVPGVLLGIYVADCCAVYLADTKGRALALLHSGKKGTELGIVPAAIETMESDFGISPENIVAQLSPCIRPPAYEIDFAAEIRDQCARSGIPRTQIHDPGTCTSSDLTRYYSYRVERGKTGRMLALLGRLPNLATDA